jgi:hypothetical protein
MTMTLDQDSGIGSTAMTSGGLIDEIAGILAQQGFTAHKSDDENGGRLTVTNAPEGICEIDVFHSGCVTCEYFPRTGVQADPARISRAVLRLLAAPQDGGPVGGHLDTHPEITLKSAVGCAMKARGLMVELCISADYTNFSVYADIEITNPEQLSRGTVSVTDDGCIWWECDVDELAGQAREIAMTLTSMLAPPVRRAG